MASTAQNNQDAPVVGVYWMGTPPASPDAAASSLDGGEEADSEGDEPSRSPSPSPSPPPARSPSAAPAPSRPSSPEFTAEKARPFWGYEEDEDGADPHVWGLDNRGVGPSGWMQNDVHLASDLMNAAYNSAMFRKKIRGKPIRRLNCHWERPLDHDVKPLGYNSRGDIAPPPVHIRLDTYLDQDHFSWRERRLAHSALDKVWLLHSRSERVDEAMDREFWFLSDASRNDLAGLINEEMLDDMRLVMSIVDPRKKVIYGRTLDSSPAPRLMYHVDSHTLSFSDSNGDDSDHEFEYQAVRPVPYTLSGFEQHQQFVQRKLKTIARFEKQAIQYEDFAAQAQISVQESMSRLERANSLRDILRRGIAAKRGPLDLLPAQSAFAFAAHERRREEENTREYERRATQENRPPTPP